MDEKLKMSDRRKAIQGLYSTDDSVRISLNKSATGIAGSTFNEETLERTISQLNQKSSSLEDIIKLSNYAYATESNYANIIDYLANIFTWRYFYIPVPMKEKASSTDYQEMYNLASEVIDGMAIETTFPATLTKLLKEGVVYMYAVKNTSSKTISTLLLNPKYCSPVMISQYGTGVYQFDVRYFDSFGANAAQLDALLQLYPDELVQGYRAYKAAPSATTQNILLDGRYSTFIQLNEFNFPTYLTVLRSVFDYNKYRKNEVEKSSSQLDTILTHKIPTYEDRLLFELPEVQELHRSMSRILASNSRIRLLTTFGETELHPIQPASNVENKVLEKAYEAVYQSAGMNVNLFNGQSKESLLASLERDKSIMWKFVQQLINFYNITINNLFNFKGYQIEINMLPVTQFDTNSQMEIFRRNAEYGVGKLELIVASGTKQKHIGHKSVLEDFLKLEDILKPLKSSHTQSGGEETTPKKVEEKPKEEPKE